MSVRQVDLVKLWGLSRGRVSQMVKAGMPLSTVAEADAWRMAHTGRAGSKNFSTTTSETGRGGGTPAEQLPEPPAAPSAAELERSDVHGVAARAVQAELDAWVAYYQARETHDLGLIAARAKMYREAVETRLKSEKALAEILRVSGVTVVKAEAEDLVQKAMEPVVLALRNLAATTCHRANPADPALARQAVQDEVVRIFQIMGRKS